MTSKKITYNPKTRNDISNPYNKFSHEDLLKLGCVDMFNGKFIIETLPSGRIKVIKKEKNSKNK